MSKINNDNHKIEEEINNSLNTHEGYRNSSTDQYQISNVHTDEFCLIPDVYADSFDDNPWDSNWYDIPAFDPNSMWIARADNIIVGYLISFVNKEKPYISVIAVRKAYHRLGIASNLINKCVGYWQSRGYEEIRVHVNHESLDARKLYNKHGFKVLEIDEKDTYMSKVI